MPAPIEQIPPRIRRMRRFSQIACFAAPLVVAALALWLYLPSLGFGFMYDDPLDLPRATDRSWLDVLTSAGATMYYRPLPLVIWRSLHDLLGRNDGTVLHALVIALHAANGVLVYALGRRLYRDVAAGLVAGALFVSFPFSYQAVMHTATTYHPLATFCALGAVVIYLGWRDGGSRLLLPSGLLLAALAMLAHEYGVVVAALVFGVEAFWLAEHPSRRLEAGAIGARLHSTRDAAKKREGVRLSLAPERDCGAVGTGSLPAAVQIGGRSDCVGDDGPAHSHRRTPGLSNRPSPAILAFAGLALGYVAVWAGAPKWSQSLAVLGSARQNLAYFLQAIAYPFASELDRLPTTAGASPSATIVAAAIATIIALAVVSWSASRLSAFALALFWSVVAFAPTLTLLAYSYVVDGPRLLYLASVGICLVWAGALTAPLAWSVDTHLPPWGGRLRGIGFAVSHAIGLSGLIVAALVTWEGIAFVTARTPIFAVGADVVRQIVATATDPDRPGRTYVNVPSWLALKSSDYPLGHSGAAVIPSYIGLGRVVYIVAGRQPEIASLTVESLKRDWGLYYEPHGPIASPAEIEQAYRRGGGVYVARYGGERAGSYGVRDAQLSHEGVALEYVGEIRSRSPFVGLPLAAFGDWLRLEAAEITRADDDVETTLRWRAIAVPTRDETVFLHIYGPTGKLVAQTDGYALGNTFPLNRWRTDDEVVDVRRITLPAGLPAGEYRVAVGIYDRASGTRAAALDAKGSSFRDDAAIVATIKLP